MKLNMPKVMILGNFRSRFSQGRRRAVGAGEFEVCGNLRNTKGREGAEEKKIRAAHWESIRLVSYNGDESSDDA